MTGIVRLSFCVATDTIEFALAHRNVVALTLLELPADLPVSRNKEKTRLLWTHVHNLSKTQDTTLTALTTCSLCFLLLRAPRLFGWADEAEPEGAGRASICCDGGRAL